MKQTQVQSEVLSAIRTGHRPTISVVSAELLRLKTCIGQLLEREDDPREYNRIALRRSRHALLAQHGELKAYLRVEEQRRAQERQERATP